MRPSVRAVRLARERVLTQPLGMTVAVAGVSARSLAPDLAALLRPGVALALQLWQQLTFCQPLFLHHLILQEKGAIADQDGAPCQ